MSAEIRMASRLQKCKESSPVREAFLVLFALELHKCLVPQISKVIYIISELP